MDIEFTTTALARPEVIDNTYSTFERRLQGIDLKCCKLFINIDPIPECANRSEVVEIAKKYFGEVHANLPKTANFSRAVNWVWSNANSDLIMHIEDDWILLADVDMNIVKDFFKNNNELFCVILKAYGYNYWRIPLSPSIMHKRFYKAVGGNLDENINPEIQIRGRKFGIEMPCEYITSRNKMICYNHEKIIRDIGLEWAAKNDYIKPELKENFTTLIKRS